MAKLILKMRDYRDAFAYRLIRLIGYRVVAWEANLHESKEGRTARITKIILRD